MNLTEIENLSAAELKARRDEVRQYAAMAATAELADRYVQARLDAKLRDEKLAEQGATLTALQQGNAALTEKAAALEQQLAAVRDEFGNYKADAAALIGELKVTAEKLAADLAVASRRADEQATLAKARRVVLAKITSDIAPLLAAE